MKREAFSKTKLRILRRVEAALEVGYSITAGNQFTVNGCCVCLMGALAFDKEPEDYGEIREDVERTVSISMWERQELEQGFEGWWSSNPDSKFFKLGEEIRQTYVETR